MQIESWTVCSYCSCKGLVLDFNVVVHFCEVFKELELVRLGIVKTELLFKSFKELLLLGSLLCGGWGPFGI